MLSNQDDRIYELVREMRGRVRGEFDDNNTTKTSNRVCRSSPILESNASENACERACVDAYYHSTSLKFHADEQKMKEYESLRTETCKKECSRAFLSEQQRGNEDAED